MIVSLPLRLGGHGLRSAVRMSSGAFWASWGDAMHMVADRLPTVAHQILNFLDTDAPSGCLEELQEAARALDHHGFVNKPTWEQLRFGARPPRVDAERGEWQHGMAISRVFRFRTPLSGNRDFCHDMCCGPSASSFPLGPRSWGGSGGMPHWVRIPTATRAFLNVGVGKASFTTQHYRRGVLMRGGTGHDGFAENQGTRPRAFLGANLSRSRGIRPLQREASRHERGRVCERREGHRGVGVGFAPPPWRAIGRRHNGPQRNHLHGAPCHERRTHQRGSVDGRQACQGTEYRELLEGERCRLVVVGIETGGRWSTETVEFVDMMAGARAREVPPMLRQSAHLAWCGKWRRMLVV